MRRILVIDDEINLLRVLADHLADDSTDVFTAETGKEGLRICSTVKIDVVLLDQRLPDTLGEKLCEPLLSLSPRMKIIFMTAYPSFNHVVEALRLGVYDYLSKPFDLEELEMVIERAMRLIQLEGIEEVNKFHRARNRKESVLIGEDPLFVQVRKLADLAAQSRAPVLITGETGAGKNVIAKYIHYRSSDYEKPFVTVNAAAIPRELMESELFGHEKGAFTGANQTRKGMFELADEGTLFLDEIGNLIPELQVKLLSVLEEQQVRRVGATRSRDVRVRIITATNALLDEEIRRGRFREDLFYRLNVIHLNVPPLRERREDIHLLCQHFISRLCRTREVVLPQSEIDALKAYDWPGNVRELGNIIERTLTLQQGEMIYPSVYLQPPAVSPSRMATNTGKPEESDGARIESRDPCLLSMAEMEIKHILETFDWTGGNLAETARVLKISESTLRRRMKTFRNTHSVM